VAFAGDPMAHLSEPGQSLDIVVDQVTGPLPFVPLHRIFGLLVPQASKARPAESPGDSGGGSPQQRGNVAEMQALVTQIHLVMQLPRIECPTLGTANTSSIRQRGWTAVSVTGEPAVSEAKADSVHSDQHSKAAPC
jgi:hypothetical protein